MVKEVFEKIIEKLEKASWEETDISMVVYTDDAIEIVKQAATEYNNGWIPCSERLPKEKDGTVLICCEDGKVITGIHSEFSDTWYKGEMCGIGGSNVIAWQPLPEPYKQE